jgi:cullin 3
MVLHRSGAMLYNGVNQLVAENLDKLANEEIVPVFSSRNSDRTQQSQEAELLLKALRHVWDDHLGNMLKLSQILKYMVGPTSRKLDSRLDVGIN